MTSYIHIQNILNDFSFEKHSDARARLLPFILPVTGVSISQSFEPILLRPSYRSTLATLISILKLHTDEPRRQSEAMVPDHNTKHFPQRTQNKQISRLINCGQSS